MIRCSHFRVLMIAVLICFPGLALADEGLDAKKAVESMLADYRAAWMEGSEVKVMNALSEEVQPFIPSTGVGKLAGNEDGRWRIFRQM